MERPVHEQEATLAGVDPLRLPPVWRGVDEVVDTGAVIRMDLLAVGGASVAELAIFLAVIGIGAGIGIERTGRGTVTDGRLPSVEKHHRQGQDGGIGIGAGEISVRGRGRAHRLGEGIQDTIKISLRIISFLCLF